MFRSNLVLKTMNFILYDGMHTETMDFVQFGDAMEMKELARPDASGISCAKAKRLIGWEPKRTWRDYLDEDGRAKPPAAL